MQNIIDNILQLLTDEELLKKERDLSKNIRERFKGVSSE